MASDTVDLEFRSPVTSVAEQYAIEEAVYPDDEAASLAKLEFRHRTAPELSLGGYVDGRLVGYISATAACGDELTHASMATHDADGRNVCIHSVATHPAYRRRGIARALLRGFAAHLRALDPAALRYERITLICKRELVALYQSCGYTLRGPSAVVHGADPWFELFLTLPPSA